MTNLTAEPFAELARRFHETYERLAPKFGYETRESSAVPWEVVPEKNKKLMIAVCAEIFGPFREQAARQIADRYALNDCTQKAILAILDSVFSGRE